MDAQPASSPIPSSAPPPVPPLGPSSPAPDIEARLAPWRGRISPRLHPALDRHHQNLVALCGALAEVGHPPDVVRTCLRDLLASYEAELIHVLAGELARDVTGDVAGDAALTFASAAALGGEAP